MCEDLLKESERKDKKHEKEIERLEARLEACTGK